MIIPWHGRIIKRMEAETVNLKKKIIVLGSVLVAGIGVQSVFALSEIHVENQFSTGVVDVGLKEYTLDENGNEVLWQNVENILPGDRISKVPRITNYGNDCYVRVKTEFINTTLDMNDVYGMDTDWILADDGYYYYSQKLSTGDNVDLFKGISIPNDLNMTFQETQFQLKIQLEAIQSKNFTPNFMRSSPWGNVEIIECQKEGMYYMAEMQTLEKQTFTVRYEGDTNQLIKNADDFFSNFPVMLPGDCYADSIEFFNDGKKRIPLYFRTSNMEKNDKNCEDLLEKIHLKITKFVDGKSEIIYDGAIHAKELNQGVELCKLNPLEKGELLYEIETPSELNNCYSLMEEKVVWVFSTEYIEDEPVPTGDSENFLAFKMVIVGISCVVIYHIIGNYRKGAKRNAKKNQSY